MVTSSNVKLKQSLIYMVLKLRLKLTVIIYKHCLFCVLKFYLCYAFRVQCNRDFMLMPNFILYLITTTNLCSIMLVSIILMMSKS